MSFEEKLARYFIYFVLALVIAVLGLDAYLSHALRGKESASYFFDVRDGIGR